MNHDVIADRYARLYEQPYQLAKRGHDVLGLCLSYRHINERDEWHDSKPGSLQWIGLTLSANYGFGYPQKALNIFKAFQPDMIVAASDGPHIILGKWLAGKLNVPFAADLYDHFETFGLSSIPGINQLYRSALRKAAVVSCVSEPLSNLVRDIYHVKGRVLTLPSTIDRKLFYPRNRLTCRVKLGLPKTAKLIGTAGGLFRERGIVPLYQAFIKLSKDRNNLYLILAGPLDPKCPPPNHHRVKYLGVLPHSQTAELFCALDVGVVYLRDTPYGRFSFPQKAYEIAACNVPMVLARVGAVAASFEGSSVEMYDPDDAPSLAASIVKQLNNPIKPDLKIPDWAEQAAEMEKVYLDVMVRINKKQP